MVDPALTQPHNYSGRGTCMMPDRSHFSYEQEFNLGSPSPTTLRQIAHKAWDDHKAARRNMHPLVNGVYSGWRGWGWERADADPHRRSTYCIAIDLVRPRQSWERDVPQYVAGSGIELPNAWLIADHGLMESHHDIHAFLRAEAGVYFMAEQLYQGRLNNNELATLQRSGSDDLVLKIEALPCLCIDPSFLYELGEEFEVKQSQNMQEM
ncbi:hypothetical protein ACFL0V_04530 [Nanoarchaeota archaeon]